MTRHFAILLTAVLLAVAAGCKGGSNQQAATKQPSTTTPDTGAAALKGAVRSALAENRRLSVYVLWTNKIPTWAEASTRGRALASLRAAAQNRRARGVRVRMLDGRREVFSITLDPSYVRASAIVVDHQRVQPSRRNGRPLGRSVALTERARYDLRRLGSSNRFVVWRVVLLQ